MFDLAILDEAFVDYCVNSRGWIEVDCPFCGKEKKGAISSNGKTYNCYVCGKHRLDEALSIILGIKREKVWGLLKRQGNPLFYTPTEQQFNSEVQHLELIGDTLGEEHRAYLEERNFNPTTLERIWGIKGTGFRYDKWRHRIIIPIYYKNRLVCYQGRTIRDDPLRYQGLSNEQSVLHYKELLYGEHLIPNKHSIGVVEGVFDLWRMGAGFVCTFGSSLKDSQLKLLRNYKNVYFLFDPYDDKAQVKANKYAEWLASFGVHAENVRVTDEGDDPAEFSDEIVCQIKREYKIIV